MFVGSHPINIRWYFTKSKRHPEELKREVIKQETGSRSLESHRDLNLTSENARLKPDQQRITEGMTLYKRPQSTVPTTQSKPGSSKKALHSADMLRL